MNAQGKCVCEYYKLYKLICQNKSKFYFIIYNKINQWVICLTIGLVTGCHIKAIKLILFKLIIIINCSPFFSLFISVQLLRLIQCG